MKQILAQMCAKKKLETIKVAGSLGVKIDYFATIFTIVTNEELVESGD